MRKLVLALGIVLILGIVATPIISAAPLTRDYLRYLGDNGFNILTTKEGGWFAGYTDKATAATTIAEFSTSTDLTEIKITFFTLQAGVDYRDAFMKAINTILALFPEQLHSAITDSILVTIPTLQNSSSDGCAYMVMGDFFAAGGYYDSRVGSPCFMLTMKAISK